MKKIPENKNKINKLDDFLKLNPKEIRNLSDKELVKGLRYFRNDLKYDLRKPLASRSKGKVRDIREIYISTLSVPNPSLYTPRKTHRKATAEYLGLGDKWKKFVINKSEDEKIYFKNGRLRITGKYTDVRRGIFDKDNLIKNPEKEIKRVLENELFDVTKLICGDAFIGGHKSPKNYSAGESMKLVESELLKDVTILMSVYDSPEANNYWENWLLGIELINLKNQKTKKKFKKKIGKNINRNKRKSKNGKKGNRNRRL